MASVFDVAQLINDQFGPLSKIKLQKLLYFSQAWYLHIHNTPLFAEDFYAWKNGPVVKELHETEKIVPMYIKNADINNLNDNEGIHIIKTLDIYGDLSKEELIELSHKDSAWFETELEHIITKESIKNCYKDWVCPEIYL